MSVRKSFFGFSCLPALVGCVETIPVAEAPFVKYPHWYEVSRHGNGDIHFGKYAAGPYSFSGAHQRNFVRPSEIYTVVLVKSRTHKSIGAKSNPEQRKLALRYANEKMCPHIKAGSSAKLTGKEGLFVSKRWAVSNALNIFVACV